MKEQNIDPVWLPNGPDNSVPLWNKIAAKLERRSASNDQDAPMLCSRCDKEILEGEPHETMPGQYPGPMTEFYHTKCHDEELGDVLGTATCEFCGKKGPEPGMEVVFLQTGYREKKYHSDRPDEDVPVGHHLYRCKECKAKNKSVPLVPPTGEPRE